MPTEMRAVSVDETTRIKEAVRCNVDLDTQRLLTASETF